MVDELRELATQLRAIAAQSRTVTRVMRDFGITSCALFHGDAMSLHADTAAQHLEDQADERERGGVQ